MCILSDRDIKELIKEGSLVIEPLELEAQLGPSSVDLRLGDRFRVFKQGTTPYIDTKNYADEVVVEYESQDGVVVEEGRNSVLYKNMKSFIVHPGEFILGSTLERVELPDDIVGRLEGRSSLGRLGLIVHATAGYIDPGFRGHITLEIGNVGKLPIKIYTGMRFCQIVFERMCSSAEVPYHKKKGSKYVGEEGATLSRISKDFGR